VASGRAKEAEAVYWQDLARNPENGFSLRGLAEVYDVLDQSPQAETALGRLKSAWGAADTKLSTSRY
jgi:hypothetical protein